MRARGRRRNAILPVHDRVRYLLAGRNPVRFCQPPVCEITHSSADACKHRRKTGSEHRMDRFASDALQWRVDSPLCHRTSGRRPIPTSEATGCVPGYIPMSCGSDGDFSEFPLVHIAKIALCVNKAPAITHPPHNNIGRDASADL